ncbi:ISLre2 family transposase, partial [Streptococcus anginosus]|nr:ISLre2 family transposase [Streptococcus anginosus]
RYSKELIYQIAELSTMMSYDHVVKVVQMMYHVKITKPTVIKTVKFAYQLRNQYEEYQYYQEEVKKKDKIKAD